MRKTYIEPCTRYAELTPEELMQGLGMGSGNADPNGQFLGRQNVWDEEECDEEW